MDSNFTFISGRVANPQLKSLLCGNCILLSGVHISSKEYVPKCVLFDRATILSFIAVLENFRSVKIHLY